MTYKEFISCMMGLSVIVALLYGAATLEAPEVPTVHNIKHEGAVFVCLTYKESMQCFVKVASVPAPTAESSEDVIAIQSLNLAQLSYTVQF